MGLIYLLLLGSILGWIASIILQTGEKRHLAINIISGIGGAVLAGVIINPLIGMGNLLQGAYSVDALLAALGGSIALVVAVNLLRNREMR